MQENNKRKSEWSHCFMKFLIKFNFVTFYHPLFFPFLFLTKHIITKKLLVYTMKCQIIKISSLFFPSFFFVTTKCFYNETLCVCVCLFKYFRNGFPLNTIIFTIEKRAFMYFDNLLKLMPKWRFLSFFFTWDFL